MTFSDYFGPMYITSVIIGFLLVLFWILFSGWAGAFPKGGKVKLIAYYIYFPLLVLGPISIFTLYASDNFFDLKLLEVETKLKINQDTVLDYKLDEIIEILDDLSKNNELSIEDEAKISRFTKLSHHTKQILEGQERMLNALLREASKKFVLGIAISFIVGTSVGLIIIPALKE